VPDLVPVARRLSDPAVETAWRRLQAAGHVPSPFLSWEWCSCFRDVSELSRDIVVILVRSGHEIVGLLPVERVRDAHGLRVVGVAGRSWLSPDHSDVVAAPADRAGVARAALGLLARSPGWHVLDLDGLRADGALAGAVDDVFGGRFVRREPAGIAVTYVPLGGGIVSNHARKQVRKELRRAESSGGGFDVVTDPEQFPPLLEELMRLHNERFGSRSQVFATAARRRFHFLAAQRLGASGLVRINRLRVDGKDAAIAYHLIWGDRILFYSGGLRTDCGRTPGFSVRVCAMLRAAEDGFVEADLLRGNHGYKDRFESVVREEVRHRITRLSPRVGVVAGLAGVRRLRHASTRVRARPRAGAESL
jgi:CelD/BcsL family acetyltransferase involved in cellulose biosynthesis